MSADHATPMFIDIIGPDLTPEIAAQMKRQISQILEFELEDFELTWLHKEARHIAADRAVNAPAEGQSYIAIDDLRKAIWKFLAALEAVRAISLEPFDPSRRNIAADFLSDMNMIDGDDEEDAFLLMTPLEIIDRVKADLELMQRRAITALDSVERVPRGKGRSASGYDRFILACRQIWMRHRQDQGWSIKAGRGCGRFVTFVWTAQTLLPPSMCKKTPESVGDAVVAVLKET